MSYETSAYALCEEQGQLKKITIQRHGHGDSEIQMKILYCGICYSDVLYAYESEEARRLLPFVPGHEILGQVVKIGSKVTKFKVNDYAAVGTFVNSCRECRQCKNFNEIGCKNVIKTYNSPVDNCEHHTKGGYSHALTVDEKYALVIPKQLHKNLAPVSPLLCAGITVYTPLIQHRMNQPGKRLAVLGLGGLGHMAVKFGKAFGNHVTILSSSEHKRDDVLKNLHADQFVNIKNSDEMKKVEHAFDTIINTVPVFVDVEQYLPLLDVGGIFVYVGLTSKSHKITLCPNNMIFQAQMICGSVTGNIKLTQEMLNYCAEKGIVADIEEITPDQINTAVTTLRNKGNVKYRYVINMTKDQ